MPKAQLNPSWQSL